MDAMLRQIITAAALALMPLAAVAEPVSLADLSSYLNGLTEVGTSFRQENSDGSQSSGQLFIHRPGRMRLQYDPPEGSVVIVSGGTVSIFDAKSNQPPQQYPLFKTPLNLILAPQIDLTTAKMVTGVGEVQGLTHVIAQDPKNPDYGTIELIFTPNPVKLTGWIVTDDMGNTTTVKLGEFTAGQSFPASTFSVEIEAAKHK